MADVEHLQLFCLVPSWYMSDSFWW